MSEVDSRQVALLGKAQANPTTPVVPAPATDYIRLVNRPSIELDLSEVENKRISQQWGDGKSGIVFKAMKLPVEFFLRSGGGLGVRPDFAPLIECGNHNVVTTAGVSVAINPITATGSSRKTSTFYWYEDGLRYEFEDAMFTGFATDAPMDGNYIGKGSIIARHKAPVEAAVPAGIVEQVSDAIQVSPSDILTEAGTAITVGSFSFDSSAVCSEYRMIGGSDVHMDDRPKPLVTMSKASLGTLADYNRLINATSTILAASFGAAGNRMKFNVTDGQLASLKTVVSGIHMQRELGIAARGGDSSYNFLID